MPNPVGGAALVRGDAPAVSMADPETGRVAYRGYPVRELCLRHGYEEVAYLLWHGELPDRDQLLAQNQVERAGRALTPDLTAAIADQPPTARPASTLQTAVGVLGAKDPARHETEIAVVRAKALRLFGVLPSIIAMDQRRRQGLGAIGPRDQLSYAANFLYMTFGRVPEPHIVAAFERCLILNAGECFGGSTLISPAASGTCGDMYAAASARIGVLNGPLHAGAGEVVEMINQIAIPDNAKPWLEEALADGRPIAGFGARPDEKGDSRVSAMQAALDMVAAHRGGQDILELSLAITAVFKAEGLYPSLDFPTGLACHLIGFDGSALGCVLAAARLPSWTAHIVGQLAASSLVGGDSIERPLASSR